MTLKAAAARNGIVLGAGPVDPTTSNRTTVNPPGTVTVPPGFQWAFPTTLASASASGDIILGDFGGAIDLCSWAIGNTDLTHFGKEARWLGPGVYDFTGVDETYSWAVANGLRVWISDPAYSGVPSWMQGGGYTAAQITSHLHNWYDAVFSRYPLAYGTTFLNEMCPFEVWDEFDGTVSRTYGPMSTYWYYLYSSVGYAGGKSFNEFCASMCSWVKSANPGIRLVVNDNGIEGTGADIGPDAPGQMIAWIGELRAMGVDVDGVGVQSHFLSSSTLVPADYRSTLQRYASAGITPYVTEFDIRNDGTLQWVQAHYDMVGAIVQSGVVETLNFWHPFDPLFYGVNGALYTEPPSPVATAARNAVENALWGVPLGFVLVNAPTFPLPGTVRLTGNRLAGDSITVEER